MTLLLLLCFLEAQEGHSSPWLCYRQKLLLQLALIIENEDKKHPQDMPLDLVDVLAKVIPLCKLQLV